jgi:hypothetical protein
MRTAILVLVSAALGACTGVSPIAPSPSVPSFSYQLEPIPDVLTASDSLHLEWAPHPDPNYTTLISDVTLCFAFLGPWPDAETVKRETMTTRIEYSNLPAGWGGSDVAERADDDGGWRAPKDRRARPGRPRLLQPSPDLAGRSGLLLELLQPRRVDDV